MRKAFVKTLLELATLDGKVMLLTGDLGFSLLEPYRDRFPSRFLNVGLSEQTMVSMAAGMALEGYRVFVYSIAPFIVCRALEQIRNDLCYQQLPVKLIGVGSGLAYGADGGSHHSIDDLGLMTSLPDMIVLAPGDPLETEMAVKASMSFDLPCYIRLNRSGDPVVHHPESVADWKLGQPLRIRGENTAPVILVGCGNMLPLAVAAWEELDRRGVSAQALSVHTLKPVDGEQMRKFLSESRLVVSLEDHVERNGLTALLRRWVPEERLLPMSLGDGFIHDVGGTDYLRCRYGLDRDVLVTEILNRLSLGDSGGCDSARVQV
jgi:transketolase